MACRPSGPVAPALTRGPALPEASSVMLAATSGVFFHRLFFAMTDGLSIQTIPEGLMALIFFGGL